LSFSGSRPGSFNCRRNAAIEPKFWGKFCRKRLA
jgi:hypothetical protein